MAASVPPSRTSSASVNLQVGTIHPTKLLGSLWGTFLPFTKLQQQEQAQAILWQRRMSVVAGRVPLWLVELLCPLCSTKVAEKQQNDHSDCQVKPYRDAETAAVRGHADACLGRWVSPRATGHLDSMGAAPVCQRTTGHHIRPPAVQVAHDLKLHEVT